MRAAGLALGLALVLAGCGGVSLMGTGGSESKPEVGVSISFDRLFNWGSSRPTPDPEPGSKPRPRVPEEERGPPPRQE